MRYPLRAKGFFGVDEIVGIKDILRRSFSDFIDYSPEAGLKGALEGLSPAEETLTRVCEFELSTGDWGGMNVITSGEGRHALQLTLVMAEERQISEVERVLGLRFEWE